MPAPSAVRRRSAREGRARCGRRWMPPHAAAPGCARRACATRATAGTTSSVASPSAVSTGRGERDRTELAAARSRWCGRRTARTTPSRCATGTAAYATRSSRHDSSSSTHVPTRKTTSAGTSRLRYDPTGSSTVTRSFHASTAPGASSPSPRSSSAGAPRREGTASGTPSSEEGDRQRSAATSQPLQPRHHATAAMPPPTRAADDDQQHERPVAVDRPGRDRGDRDDDAPRTRSPRRCAARRPRQPGRGDAWRGIPTSMARSRRRPPQEQPGEVVERADGEHRERRQRLHARVGALVADDRDDRRVGRERERRLLQPGRAAPAIRRRRTRSRGARPTRR